MTGPTLSPDPSSALIVAGAQALVQSVDRLGIRNQVRIGTTLERNPTKVMLDGDTVPVTVVRTGGAGWVLGSRVYVLETPGAYFILGQTTPLEAATTVTITPVANTPTSADVLWGFTFPETPVVTTTPETTTIGSIVLGTSASSITTVGCRVWIYRTNTTATNVHVHAIQRTSIN